MTRAFLKAKVEEYRLTTTVMGNSDKMCHASLQQNSLLVRR